MDRNHADTDTPPARWVFHLQVIEVVALISGSLLVLLH